MRKDLLIARNQLVLPDHSHYDLRSAFGDTIAPAGMARGVNTEGDVITQTVDGRDLNEIWAEFQASLTMWNDKRSALVSFLTFPVTQPIEVVPQITGEDFERASEFGVPKSIRGGDWFQMGYDFEWYDIAQRFTWKYLAEATAAQVESVNNMALEADNRLLFNAVLRAIFNSANPETDIRGQNIPVYPFYTGDGTVPPLWKTYAFDGTHTHYLTSGAAVVDSGDLDDISLHMAHHGYGRQNGSTQILLVNEQELNTIRTFRVATGASYDYVPAAGGAPWLLPTVTGGVVTPQGSAIPSQINGMPVAGQYGNLLILQEDYIPPGYLVAFATGGENAATNPVGIREHQNAGLRGLRLVKGKDADYPLIDSYYNRGFGTGIRHRGAGVVMQIKAADPYIIPAAYV
jgi:hypothetical protein